MPAYLTELSKYVVLTSELSHEFAVIL